MSTYLFVFIALHRRPSVAGPAPTMSTSALATLPEPSAFDLLILYTTGC